MNPSMASATVACAPCCWGSAGGQLTEQALGLLAGLLWRPGRTVPADGVPALLAAGAELEHVHLAAGPGTHAEAAEFGVP